MQFDPTDNRGQYFNKAFTSVIYKLSVAIVLDPKTIALILNYTCKCLYKITSENLRSLKSILYHFCN